MSLESLPTELLIIIVKQVVTEANLDEEFYREWPAGQVLPPDLSCKNRSLLPLSTTSRSLREITLPILFSCLVVAAEDSWYHPSATYLEPLHRLHALLCQRPHIASLVSSIETFRGYLANNTILSYQRTYGMEQQRILADILTLLPRATRLPEVYAPSEEFMQSFNSLSIDAVDVHAVPEISPDRLTSDPKFLRKVWIKKLDVELELSWDLHNETNALRAGMNIRKLVIHPGVEHRQKIVSLPFNYVETIYVRGFTLNENERVDELSDWLSSTLQGSWSGTSHIEFDIKGGVRFKDPRGTSD